MALLPFALPPNSYNRPSGQRDKPSAVSVSAGHFIHFVDRENDLAHYYDQLCGEGNDYKHPYVVVVGSIGNIEKCHVRLYDTDLSTTGSLIEAVDLCFKCFFTFNLKYPIKCEHVWITLQRIAYNIDVANGSRYPAATNELIENLRNLNEPRSA